MYTYVTLMLELSIDFIRGNRSEELNGKHSYEIFIF